MIGLLTLLLVVGVIGVVSTVRELRLDRPREIPQSHAVDRDSRRPADLLG
ncbi:hypothetical protein [Nocardioides humilatus]|nr:hypothetical protein [Nocardioides humilatus]